MAEPKKVSILIVVKPPTNGDCQCNDYDIQKKKYWLNCQPKELEKEKTKGKEKLSHKCPGGMYFLLLTKKWAATIFFLCPNTEVVLKIISSQNDEDL